uniref:Uncharacterized protein n=1 Tax=Anguilla anguilla TaxID=7936 RepID=A0A0E9WV55_ANGAN
MNSAHLWTLDGCANCLISPNFLIKECWIAGTSTFQCRLFFFLLSIRKFLISLLYSFLGFLCPKNWIDQTLFLF